MQRMNLGKTGMLLLTAALSGCGSTDAPSPPPPVIDWRAAGSDYAGQTWMSPSDEIVGTKSPPKANVVQGAAP